MGERGQSAELHTGTIPRPELGSYENVDKGLAGLERSRSTFGGITYCAECSAVERTERIFGRRQICDGLLAI